ncbi:MAG: hypothetical protein AAGF10_02890 [Verrucomicrobiota bacterium]
MKTCLPSLLLLGCSVMLTTGCSDLIHGKSLAGEAITHFHERYNAEDFEGIYDRAAPAFRKADSQANYNNFFSSVRKKLGPVESTENTYWHVNANTSGSVVDMVQKTTYADGASVEKFKFQLNDGIAKLLYYRIDSDQLVVRTIIE